MKRIIPHILLSLALVAPMAACSDDDNLPVQPPREELPDVPDEISGEPYDWTVTGAPERPYMHDYSRSMMLKFHMAQPDREGGSKVYVDYAGALEWIKGLDAISRGLHKIVYLVGWQYNGHDDKYPAMDEFNEALKRPEDATARDSFFWLREEAAKYNTTVSIHTLINDAYADSPLWHEYVKNGFICRDANGEFVSDGNLNGQPMYWVDIYTEWRKGRLQKRLDDVVELCGLADVHTIHLDAFQPHENVYADVTVEMSQEVCRKVVRYLRDKEIDVTAEFYHGTTRTDWMVGLQAAAWWNDLSNFERAAIPASVAAGGRAGQFTWNLNPEAAFLFGENMMAETTIDATVDNGMGLKAAWAELRRDFCLMTLPYMYFNAHQVVEYKADRRRVEYTDGLVSDYSESTVRQNGALLRDRNNVFFPAVWITDHREIIAYSANGYGSRTWTLPAGWSDVTSVTVTPVTEAGPGESYVAPVLAGTVTLSLGTGEMVSIQAD